MKTKYRIIMMVMCAVLSLSARAQDTHWQCNVYDYQYDMTLYYILEADDVVVNDPDGYEVGAFVDGECRGVGKVLTSQTLGGETVTFGYLRIRSNSQSGETVTFRCYDKTTEQEYDVKAEGIPFVANSMMGQPSEPVVLSFATYILGDVDGDGEITAQDAALVLQVVAGKLSSEADGLVYQAANVDGDAEVTAQDASLILQHVAGKINIGD